MKILRCIHSLDPAIGGPLESVTAIVARARRGAGTRWRSSRSTIPRRRGAGISRDRPRARAGPRQLRIRAAFRALVEGAARGDYDAVVVHGIWQYHSFGVWRALHRTRDAIFRFPARDARPVVQPHLPAQASEEIALLAVGRISRPARCRGGALHLGRRAAAGAGIVPALSLPARWW